MPVILVPVAAANFDPILEDVNVVVAISVSFEVAECDGDAVGETVKKIIRSIFDVSNPETENLPEEVVL